MKRIFKIKLEIKLMKRFLFSRIFIITSFISISRKIKLHIFRKETEIVIVMVKLLRLFIVGWYCW